MIETIIGIVFAVIAIAMAVQANKEHMDATGVPMPSSNARRRIRRNARKKGISEDQAYATWLAWHQKNRGINVTPSVRGVDRSAGLAQTRATGVTGYTAADLKRLQREMEARRPSESELQARKEQDEIERIREIGYQNRMQLTREREQREAHERAERIAKSRSDAEYRLRNLGSEVVQHETRKRNHSRLEELRAKHGISYALDDGDEGAAHN